MVPGQGGFLSPDAKQGMTIIDYFVSIVVYSILFHFT